VNNFKKQGGQGDFSYFWRKITKNYKEGPLFLGLCEIFSGYATEYHYIREMARLGDTIKILIIIFYLLIGQGLNALKLNFLPFPIQINTISKLITNLKTKKKQKNYTNIQ